MEKKYQVFVSSTYTDLKEERREVIQALLELDCIPVGMELFNASDDDQWSYITNVIDSCDYYVVIVAGRYGSVHPETGKSYTQMEYEYALSKNIPIIGFIHKNVARIPAGKSEETVECRNNLEEFKKIIQSKMVKCWETAHELGGLVSRSMVNLKKSHPALGWIRADNIVTEENYSIEMLKVLRENTELKEQIQRLTFNAPVGTEELSH